MSLKTFKFNLIENCFFGLQIDHMIENCLRVKLRDIKTFFKKSIVFAGSAIIVFEDIACFKKSIKKISQFVKRYKSSFFGKIDCLQIAACFFDRPEFYLTT